MAHADLPQGVVSIHRCLTLPGSGKWRTGSSAPVEMALRIGSAVCFHSVVVVVSPLVVVTFTVWLRASGFERQVLRLMQLGWPVALRSAARHGCGRVHVAWALARRVNSHTGPRAGVGCRDRKHPGPARQRRSLGLGNRASWLLQTRPFFVDGPVLQGAIGTPFSGIKRSGTASS